MMEHPWVVLVLVTSAPFQLELRKLRWMRWESASRRIKRRESAFVHYVAHDRCVFRSIATFGTPWVSHDVSPDVLSFGYIPDAWLMAHTLYITHLRVKGLYIKGRRLRWTANEVCLAVHSVCLTTYHSDNKTPTLKQSIPALMAFCGSNTCNTPDEAINCSV